MPARAPYGHSQPRGRRWRGARKRESSPCSASFLLALWRGLLGPLSHGLVDDDHVVLLVARRLYDARVLTQGCGKVGVRRVEEGWKHSRLGGRSLDCRLEERGGLEVSQHQVVGAGAQSRVELLAARCGAEPVPGPLQILPEMPFLQCRRQRTLWVGVDEDGRATRSAQAVCLEAPSHNHELVATGEDVATYGRNANRSDHHHEYQTGALHGNLLDSLTAGSAIPQAMRRVDGSP